MDWLINAAYYVIPFVVLLGILVFVHEFGHYIIAKLCGVKQTLRCKSCRVFAGFRQTAVG